jgi:SAM-dependent methyltransferase
MRDMPARFSLLFPGVDFRGKTVLDLGCNLGLLCKEVIKRGATRAVGVDNCLRIIAEAGRSPDDRLNFVHFDINAGLGGAFSALGLEKFDFVFALSVIKHVKVSALFDIISYYTRNMAWIELNPGFREEPFRTEVCPLVRRPHRLSKIGIANDRRRRANFALEMVGEPFPEHPLRFLPPVNSGKIGRGVDYDPTINLALDEIHRCFLDGRRLVSEQTIFAVPTASVLQYSRRRRARRALASWWTVPELGRPFIGNEKWFYLSTSLLRYGWIVSQPINFLLTKKGILMTNGHHRLGIANKLGIATVPCSVTYEI